MGRTSAGATSTSTGRCWTVSAEGPLAASAFRDPDGPPRGSWWDWAPAKHVLEDLFDQGMVLVHDRVNFERRYDLAERVVPPGTDTSEPTAAEAARELTLLAARHLGVGNAADLADYYRPRPAEARAHWPRRSPPGCSRRWPSRAGPSRPTCSPGRRCRAGWPTRRCCSARSTR